MHNRASHRAALTRPALAVICLFALVPALPHVSSVGYTSAATNPVVAENQQPGTTEWQLGRPGFRTSDDATGQIKGYASAVSVNRGESITFHLTVSPAQQYTIDVYRVGWYDGAGARLMQHVAAQDGVTQPRCPVDASTGLIECGWSPSYTLAVPATWTSGVYLALLTNARNYQDYITFTVRDDGRTADFLFQQSVTTYQAYNNYPADGVTGKSTYDYNSYGPDTVAGKPRAVTVSFDRPYTSSRQGAGSGDFLRWEVHLVRWLERNGYDVAYTTSVDTHRNPARILSFKGFLSTGHDEYYSRDMYDALEAARGQGVSLAFFGANAIVRQIRFEPSAVGTPDRRMVNYKKPGLDPVADPALETVSFRDLGRPEQRLIGIQYTALVKEQAAYVAINTSHWAYAGSMLTDGDTLPGVVGYETDRRVGQVALPENTTYTLLASSPVTKKGGGQDVHNTSLYQAPSGAWVFASGTMSWSWALDNTSGTTVADPRLQQVTRNILDRFLSPGSPVPTPTPTPTPSPTQPPSTNLLTNPGFEADADGDGQPDGWTENARFARSDAIVHTGSFAGRFQGTRDAGATVQQSVSVGGGERYAVSGWVNVGPTSDDHRLLLKLTWKGSSGTLGTVTPTTMRGATGGWTEISGTAVAPVGATSVVVKIVVQRLDTTICVDDVALVTEP